MRALRWGGLLALAVLTACSSGNYQKIRIELPVPQETNLSEFRHIVMTSFFLKNEISDFDANQEMLEFLPFELGMGLEKDVSTLEAIPSGEEVFEDRDFWKTLVQNPESTLVITGSLEYKSETRKALIGKERKQFDDPFPNRSRLATRKFFTLSMTLYFINAATGEQVFKRDFKETQGSDNPNQTAQFAFTDLLHDIKDKLLRRVAGGERVQERYLIY